MTRFSRLGTVFFLTLLGAAMPACRKGAVTAPAAALPSDAPGARAQAPLPASRAEGSGYPFTPAEKEAVDEFLRRHPDLRLALDGDRRESRDRDDMRRLYGVYHPFFVRGDLNDDGVLDFVVAFVRRDSSRDSPWFSVVVFTGRGGPGKPSFGSGAFLERDVSLARGDLSIDRDAVLITPDLADEAVRRYRWDPLRRSYVFVRDEADEDDTPVPSRT